MKIRTFDESDTADVVALWSSVFGYPQPHNDPLSAIRRKLAVERELFFIAALDSRFCGTVMGGYDGHRGWGYSLAVAEPFRQRGVGTALMRHLEQALAARDCPKINLQILPSNAGVVSLYEKLGYKVEDRISMGKLLAPPAQP
jgi:ribosomal protein S18 acetylase RimI-like enzyme